MTDGMTARDALIAVEYGHVVGKLGRRRYLCLDCSPEIPWHDWRDCQSFTRWLLCLRFRKVGSNADV